MLIARVSCCRSHILHAGKQTVILTDHIKQFDMDAKLNDKNLQALEEFKMGDVDMGMTTPALLSAPAESSAVDIKSEFPTLPLLDDALKAAKNAHLTWAMPNVSIVSSVLLVISVCMSCNSFDGPHIIDEGFPQLSAVISLMYIDHT